MKHYKAIIVIALLFRSLMAAQLPDSELREAVRLYELYNFNPHLLSGEEALRAFTASSTSFANVILSGFGRALAYSPNLASHTVMTTGYGYQYSPNIGQSFTNTSVVNAFNNQTAYAMLCLTRYNYVTGKVDTTLNPNAVGITGTKGAGYQGQVITNFGSNTFPLRMVVQYHPVVAHQKIIITGYTYVVTASPVTSQYAIFVARYNWDGTLDTAFNPTGTIPGIVVTVVSAIPNQPGLVSGISDQSFAVALQPTDHKIVVTGTASSQLFVARYNNSLTVPATAGTLDTTFNPKGYTYNFNATVPQVSVPNTTSPGIFICSILGTISYANAAVSVVGYDAGYALAIQPDNKIVVAGTGSSLIQPSNSTLPLLPSGATNSNNLGPNQIILVRLTPTGVPDSTFGQTLSNGLRTGVQVTTLIGFDDRAYALGVQVDGNIVVAGTSSDVSGNYAMSIIRYTSAGVLDLTFGNLVYGNLKSPLGQVLVGPYGTVNMKGKVLIYVLNTATSFNPWSVVNALRLQPDHKIVVAGYNAYNIGTSRFAITVARLLPTGQLDPSFNAKGIPEGYSPAIAPVPASFVPPKQPGVQTIAVQGLYDQANDVALQPDGSGDIMVAASSWNTGATAQFYQFTLARLLSNGLFDKTVTWNPLIFSFTNV